MLKPSEPTAKRSKTKNPYHEVTADQLEAKKSTTTGETTWEAIARENGWPNPILLKNMTPDRLPGFPYSRGGFRNRVTGKDAEPELTEKIFFIGKYPAIRREDLVAWLDEHTTRNRAA